MFSSNSDLSPLGAGGTPSIVMNINVSPDTARYPGEQGQNCPQLRMIALGDAVVKSPCFHSGGHRFNPWLGR